MTPNEAAAKALYEATINTDHAGKWEDQPQDTQVAWMRRADVVITAYLKAKQSNQNGEAG